MKKLFRTSGNWYKGNLHMHTSRSDGEVSLDVAINIYKNAGYDFISITDHWIQGEDKMEDGFLMINGCEWDTGDMLKYQVYHIVGIGMESEVMLKRSPSLPPQEIIDAIVSAKGIPILAHPAWSVTNPLECMSLNGLCGVELYNSVSDLPFNGRRSDSSIYFDLWAAQGKLFGCMAADDSHFYKGEETRSFIMVNAEELSKKAIKDALLKGDYYASQGPLFYSIEYNDEVVEVKCQEVETIVFYSNTVWCPDRVFTGGVDCATYKIKPTDQYVRIELIDSNGNMAWSSPFFVNGCEKNLDYNTDYEETELRTNKDKSKQR